MWVDVKEKMPRKHENVLVTLLFDEDSKIVVMAQRVTNGWDISETDDAYTVFDNDVLTQVTAWCELPKPYGE